MRSGRVRKVFHLEIQVDHLFSGADDDGNDVLSFDEVLKNHDLFVGSEATDYGDHLHNLHRSNLDLKNIY